MQQPNQLINTKVIHLCYSNDDFKHLPRPYIFVHQLKNELEQPKPKCVKVYFSSERTKETRAKFSEYINKNEYDLNGTTIDFISEKFSIPYTGVQDTICTVGLCIYAGNFIKNKNNRITGYINLQKSKQLSKMARIISDKSCNNIYFKFISPLRRHLQGVHVKESTLWEKIKKQDNRIIDMKCGEEAYEKIKIDLEGTRTGDKLYDKCIRRSLRSKKFFNENMEEIIVIIEIYQTEFLKEKNTVLQAIIKEAKCGDTILINKLDDEYSS